MTADSIDPKLAASTSSQAAKAEVLSENTLQQRILANPLDQFIINAWWKQGAMDHAFAKDAGAWHERLGDSHAPNHLLQKYSAIFLVCMREKNGKPLQKPFKTKYDAENNDATTQFANKSVSIRTVFAR